MYFKTFNYTKTKKSKHGIYLVNHVLLKANITKMGTMSKTSINKKNSQKHYKYTNEFNVSKPFIIFNNIPISHYKTFLGQIKKKNKTFRIHM